MASNSQSVNTLEKLIRQGWRELNPTWNIETLPDPSIFLHYLKSYVITVSKEVDCYRGLPFPFNLLVALENYESKEAEANLKSLFSKEKEKELNANSILFGDALSKYEHLDDYDLGIVSSSKKTLKDKWLILTIVNSLGKPKQLKARINSEYIELEKDPKNWQDVLSILEAGELPFSCSQRLEFTITWGNACLKFNTDANDKIIGLELRVSEKETVNEALAGKAIQKLKNGSRAGDLTAKFPIDNSNKAARDLLHQVEDELDQNPDKLTVLLKGAPGTGKTEWIKSYIENYLKPRGFFTYFLDPTTIQNFNPHPSIDKICVVINEVDNLVLDRSTTTEVGTPEAMLGFFDGSIYNSVNATQQQVLTLMTCNNTSRLDKAFLRKGRVDIQKEFKKKYV